MMRLITGDGAKASFVYVDLVRTFISEDAAAFTAQLSPEGAFRVLDHLDSRVLDEGSGPAGAASLLRRIHENVEFLGFRVTRMRWIAGGVAYDWAATFRNWGGGPARSMAGTLSVFVADARARDIDLHLDGDAYLDLVHDGRAPRPWSEAARQRRRVGL